MRTVWLLTACCLLVIAAPSPLTVAGCAIAVALLVVGDVIAAPSPRSLRVQRSVKRSVRLGDSTTSTLTVANTGRRRMTAQIRDAWPPSAASSTRPVSLMSDGPSSLERTEDSPCHFHQI